MNPVSRLPKLDVSSATVPKDEPYSARTSVGSEVGESEESISGGITSVHLRAAFGGGVSEWYDSRRTKKRRRVAHEQSKESWSHLAL